MSTSNLRFVSVRATDVSGALLYNVQAPPTDELEAAFIRFIGDWYRAQIQRPLAESGSPVELRVTIQ